MAQQPEHCSVAGHHARRSVATRSWDVLTVQLLGHYRTAISAPTQQEDAA